MMSKKSSESEEYWINITTKGYQPKERMLRTIFKRLPKNPRCKLCYSPFDGIGGVAVRTLLGRRRSNYHPQICNACDLFAQKHPGGAEVDMAFLFADVRGSTALSEKMGNVAFSRLIDRFFRTTTDVMARSNAFIEKMMGDEVTGLFFPGMAGECYTGQAFETARKLLEATGHTDPGGPWVPVGIGVHAGRAYFGSVGSQDGLRNITVLGEAANMGARLASKASSGEIVISQAAREKTACTALPPLEPRRLELKGISDPVNAWTFQVEPEEVAP